MGNIVKTIEANRQNILFSKNSTKMLNLMTMEPKLLRQLLVLFPTNLLTLNCGFGMGYSAPFLPKIVNENFFNEEQSSWFASTLVIGQMFGSVLGPFIADKLGRKKTCCIGSVFSIIGWAVLGLSSAEWMLFAGRVITGFFDCFSMSTGIMFVSEVSERRFRGSFLNCFTLSSGFGITLA